MWGTTEVENDDTAEFTALAPVEDVPKVEEGDSFEPATSAAGVSKVKAAGRMGFGAAARPGHTRRKKHQEEEAEKAKGAGDAGGESAPSAAEAAAPDIWRRESHREKSQNSPTRREARQSSHGRPSLHEADSAKTIDAAATARRATSRGRSVTDHAEAQLSKQLREECLELRVQLAQSEDSAKARATQLKSAESSELAARRNTEQLREQLAEFKEARPEIQQLQQELRNAKESEQRTRHDVNQELHSTRVEEQEAHLAATTGLRAVLELQCLCSQLQNQAESLAEASGPEGAEILEQVRSDDARLEVVFVPGTIGMKINWATGFVTWVGEAQQAAQFGVAEGWKLIEINEQPYREDLLRSCISGQDQYKVHFLMAAQELELHRAVASSHRELEKHLALQRECEQLQRQVMIITSAERLARRHVEEEQERVLHLQRACDELRAQRTARPRSDAFRERLAPMVAPEFEDESLSESDEQPKRGVRHIQRRASELGVPVGEFLFV